MRSNSSLVLLALMLLSFSLHAQQPARKGQFSILCASSYPLRWEGSWVRINDSMFMLHFTAHIQQGWHIYSMHQPETALGEPTAIRFGPAALSGLRGATSEHGILTYDTVASLGAVNAQYEKQVDFTQCWVSHTPKPTPIEGQVHFQVCTAQTCYPPADAQFRIAWSNDR